MRRLTLEFLLQEMIQQQGNQASITNIEYFEVLSILKQDKDEFTMIARLLLKSRRSKITDLFGDDLLEYQLLESDKDGTGTYFIKARPEPDPTNVDTILGFGAYVTVPFFIREGKATMTFLGDANSLRKILKALDEYKFTYKILSIIDAKFSHDSPLGELTSKQRRVIISAFNSGYYSIPRRISSEELAEKLNIRAPTLVLHRRKAEQRILSKIING
jgi:hypothetical protein